MKPYMMKPYMMKPYMLKSYMLIVLITLMLIAFSFSGCSQLTKPSLQPILLVGMGLQPTGGFSISIDSIVMEGKTLKVSVTETVPGPEDMVTQALTYPYVLVALRGAEGNLTLIATYVGQIDSNRIEVPT